MELILYRTNDADNVINKTLSNKLSIDIALKRSANITSPQIMLEELLGIDFNDFNYAHIPDLNRYYFINQITSINNTVWQFDLNCDVLETYKNDILNSLARFRRNIKDGDYLNTSIDHNIFNTVTKFNSDVTIEDDKNLIMITVGV